MKDKRFYKINDICPRITTEQQLASIFLCTFTVRDITSLSFDMSKNGARMHASMKLFTKLSWTPDKVKENDSSLIEKYVCAAYERC